MDIAQELAVFAREEYAFNELKSLARKIRDELRRIGPSHSRDDDYRQNFDLSELAQAGRTILEKFAALEPAPVDEIAFGAIANEIHAAESKANAILQQLRKLEQDYEATENSDTDVKSFRNNPYSNWFHRIYGLERELSHVRARLSQADRLVNSRLMVLKGAAGTGKTHLVCDFAHQQVRNGSPVVLVMGQWFSQPGEPWAQFLQQLGLPGTSPDQFVGALEAAAEASNSRALVIIDALNEGRGSEVWPNHLSSFLARLRGSPWIGVLLTVRSSYDETVVSTQVQERAVVLDSPGLRRSGV